MKISILGSGSFAIAISKILTDNAHDVLLWTPDINQINEINNYRTSKFYFPNYKLSKRVSATSNLSDILNFSNVIIIALPAKFIKQTLKKMKIKLKNSLEKYDFINMSKGIDNTKLLTISQIIENIIEEKNINSISSIVGASFAKNILDEDITRLVLASNYNNKKFIKKIFENNYIILDESNDIIAIEMFSSIKNVIALASGIIEGLEYKDNTHAIIHSLGIKDMQTLSSVYNINNETLLSIAGIGDLVMTSSSKTSRNYITGFNIGKGLSIEDAIKEAKTTVEGIDSIKALKKFARINKIKLHVVNSMYNIFFGLKDPREEILKLLRTK